MFSDPVSRRMRSRLPGGCFLFFIFSAFILFFLQLLRPPAWGGNTLGLALTIASVCRGHVCFMSPPSDSFYPRGFSFPHRISVIPSWTQTECRHSKVWRWNPFQCPLRSVTATALSRLGFFSPPTPLSLKAPPRLIRMPVFSVSLGVMLPRNRCPFCAAAALFCMCMRWWC